MKLSHFVDGINTLRPYFNDPNGYHIGAEHDEFYVYATDNPISTEDVKKLLDLGWFQTDGGASSEKPEDYSIDCGWQAFT